MKVCFVPLIGSRRRGLPLRCAGALRGFDPLGDPANGNCPVVDQAGIAGLFGRFTREYGQQNRHDCREDRRNVAAQARPTPGHVAEQGQVREPHRVRSATELRQDVQELPGERFSVSEKIEAILQRVAAGTSVRFSDLFGAVASRLEVVVTFLALLELIRLKQVRAVQKNIFEEIEIAAAAT